MKFIDKQLALKLKEKGFDKPCFGWYDSENGYNDLILNTTTRVNSNYKELLESTNDIDIIIDAPTIYQTLEWLREEKKIYFNIFPYHFTGGIYCILNSIWQVNMDIKFETKEYDINIPYETYEDACIAGIEYVVEHLI